MTLKSFGNDGYSSNYKRGFIVQHFVASILSHSHSYYMLTVHTHLGLVTSRSPLRLRFALRKNARQLKHAAAP